MSASDVKVLHNKDDIKIFILFLLHRLNSPLEYEDINELVVQDGIVYGLEFAECFAELLDAGNIEEINDNGRSFYVITEHGKQIAETLKSDIVPYLRAKSLKSAFRLLDFRERGAEIKTNYQQRADGKFDLTCQIKDNTQLSLEIKIVADNEKQLEQMMTTFDDRPETVYRGVLALLTGEIDYLID